MRFDKDVINKTDEQITVRESKSYCLGVSAEACEIHLNIGMKKIRAGSRHSMKRVRSLSRLYPSHSGSLPLPRRLGAVPQKETLCTAFEEGGLPEQRSAYFVIAPLVYAKIDSCRKMSKRRRFGCGKSTIMRIRAGHWFLRKGR